MRRGYNGTYIGTVCTHAAYRLTTHPTSKQMPTNAWTNRRTKERINVHVTCSSQKSRMLTRPLSTRSSNTRLPFSLLREITQYLFRHSSDIVQT